MKKRVPFLLVVVLLTFLAEPAQAGAIKNVKFSFSTNDGIPLAKIPIQILSSNGQSNLSVDKVLSANGSATSPVYSTGVRVRIRETASIPGTSLGLDQCYSSPFNLPESVTTVNFILPRSREFVLTAKSASYSGIPNVGFFIAGETISGEVVIGSSSSAATFSCSFYQTDLQSNSYGELKFTSFEWKINERDPNNSFTVDMKYSPLPGVKMTKQLAVFNDVNGYMVPTEETVNLAQTGVGTAYFDDIPDANLTGVSTSAIGANVNLSTAVVQSDGPTTLSMSHIAPRASLYKGASVALYSRLYNSKSKKYASWKKVKTVKLSTSGKASFKVKFAGQTQYQVRSSSLTLGAKIKTVKVKKK